MNKTFRFLHRWLGLLSGLVVVIVAATGCLYAFADEIETAGMNHTGPRSSAPFLSPDSLASLTRKQLADSGDSVASIVGVAYRRPGLTTRVTWMDAQGNRRTLMIDPHTGRVVGQLRGESFFRWVLRGHRSLWMPREIGSRVVGWATALFAVVLVSGLVLWVPRRWTKSSVAARLKVKWKTGRSRRLFDLHNTLGFYVALVALIIAFTGLTWSFPPLARGYYRALTGKQMVEWSQQVSDTTHIDARSDVGRQLWHRYRQLLPQQGDGSLRFDFPQDKEGVYMVALNPDGRRYGRQSYWFHDRYSGRQLVGGGSYALPPSAMNAGDKIFRASYDIHSGSIGGMFGRVIVFVVSLIVATLPVTGFLMWWQRRHPRRPRR